MTGVGAIHAMRDAAAREIRFLGSSRTDAVFVTVFPILLVAVLAWQLAGSVIRELPVAVVDLDHSEASRSLLRHLDASPGLRVAVQPGSLDEAWSAVRSLRAYAVVFVPEGMQRDRLKGGAGTIFGYYNASYLTAGQGAARDIGDAVAAFNRRMMTEDVAMHSRDGPVRGPPLAVHASILFNAPRSFERFLLSILFPAVLSLVACLAMTAALGREVRDGSLAAWLSQSAHPAASIVGKLLPYALLFTLYGILGLAYLAQVRGHGLAGSAGLMVLGQVLLFAACAGIALLFVGLTRDMGTSLSLVGLYVGTAMAFSGATFPVFDAPLFTRAWNALLPLTAYVDLQAQQVYRGAPSADSLGPVLRLLSFGIGPGLLGAALLLRSAVPRPRAGMQAVES